MGACLYLVCGDIEGIVAASVKNSKFQVMSNNTTSVTDAQFAAAFAVNGAVATVVCLVFLYLRPRIPALYSPRTAVQSQPFVHTITNVGLFNERYDELSHEMQSTNDAVV